MIFGGGWVLNEKFLEERGKRRGRRRRVLRLTKEYLYNKGYDIHLQVLI